MLSYKSRYTLIWENSWQQTWQLIINDEGDVLFQSSSSNSEHSPPCRHAFQNEKLPRKLSERGRKYSDAHKRISSCAMGIKGKARFDLHSIFFGNATLLVMVNPTAYDSWGSGTSLADSNLIPTSFKRTQDNSGKWFHSITFPRIKTYWELVTFVSSFHSTDILILRVLAVSTSECTDFFLIFFSWNANGMTRTLTVREKLNSLADSPMFAGPPSTHYTLSFFSRIRKKT